MPLGRYFAFIGGVLLALLFLINWYLPPAVDAVAGADIDRPVIRIHSGHKWPGAVVFDTTQPTIVPPPPAVTAEAPPPPAKSPREAFALAPPPDPAPPAATPAAPTKHLVRRAKVARAPPAARVADYEMTGFRSLFPPSW